MDKQLSGSGNGKRQKTNTENKWYDWYTKPEILTWCDDRNVSHDGVPLLFEKLRSWFIRVTSSPDLLFVNYTTDEMIEYVEDCFPEQSNEYLHSSEF